MAADIKRIRRREWQRGWFEECDNAIGFYLIEKMRLPSGAMREQQTSGTAI
jgi:hypothetical protein